MKLNQLAVCLSLSAVAFATAAKADSFYGTMTAAQASCGADAVVWVDLDHGRYYKIGQYDAGKASNGIFACEKAAHAKYREAKVEPTTVAKQ